MLAKEQYCFTVILNYVLTLHNMPFSPYQNGGVSQLWQMLHVECQALKGDKVLKSLNVMRPNEPTSRVTVLRVPGFLLPQALRLPVFQQPRI